MTDPDHLASTQHVYDQSAADYAAAVGTTVSAHFETPLDRAMLNGFALLVNESGGGRVTDVGCGVGRATSYLAGQGLDIVGVDLSPGMVAVARSAHPALIFETGSLTAPPLTHISSRQPCCGIRSSTRRPPNWAGCGRNSVVFSLPQATS